MSIRSRELFSLAVETVTTTPINVLIIPRAVAIFASKSPDFAGAVTSSDILVSITLGWMSGSKAVLGQENPLSTNGSGYNCRIFCLHRLESIYAPM